MTEITDTALGDYELEERQALRRVAGLSTELQDVTEVEYRQLRLERVVLVGVWTGGTLTEAENSLAELARKIDVPVDALARTVAKVNRFAETGVDEDFGRGGNAYDLFFGDPRNKPNPCLGKIEKGPFYAIPVDIGDIGTKGGLKTNEVGNVLGGDGSPIVGLYATGNVSGAVTYDSYPGAGGTLGPAMVFGMLAAEHIALRSGNQ